LRKNDGKLPFHKFSTDDIGIIKTTDEKSTYYLGKLRNSGNNYIRMIDTYGLALVGVKRWEQQLGSTLLSVLLAFLNYIDQWKFKYIAKGQQSNNKDADPVSG
jgi:restriction endonuclease S subunit